MAAITAQVARMVGLPTSITASTAMSLSEAPLVGGQAQVADNVFDHDNGVIHQDADGKDQGKQGDPVEGIAVEVEEQQGEGQGRGDGQHDNDRFPPAQEKEDQEGDAKDRDAHVQQQFVGFLGGGLPVIAGDGHLDLRRDEVALEALHLVQHRLDHLDGIGAGPLGHRQGHRCSRDRALWVPKRT